MREPEMDRIAAWIGDVLGSLLNPSTREQLERRVRNEVAKFAERFPLYARRWSATAEALAEASGDIVHRART